MRGTAPIPIPVVVASAIFALVAGSIAYAQPESAPDAKPVPGAWQDAVVAEIRATQKLPELFAELAQRYGFNVILGAGVPDEPARAVLSNVTVGVLVDAVCAAHGLTPVVAGDVLFVLPAAKADAVGDEVRVFVVPPAVGAMADFAEQVRGIGSDGALVVFERASRVLLVRDAPARLALIAEYVAAVSEHASAAGAGANSAGDAGR